MLEAPIGINCPAWRVTPDQLVPALSLIEHVTELKTTSVTA